MGSSSSIVNLPRTPPVPVERNSKISPLFDDDSTVIDAGTDWDIISFHDDQQIPTKSFMVIDVDFWSNNSSENISPRKPVISCHQDLHSKASYIFCNPSATSTFIRYLFHGSWIVELLQIPDILQVSPSKNILQDSNLLSSCQREFLSQSLFSAISGNQLETLLTTCTCSLELSTNHPTLTFLEKSSPEHVDSVLVMTIALALQVFCRSELFLYFSEQQWSRESIRSANWRDYARVGRAQVQQHLRNLSQRDNVEHSYSLSTVALLDSLYVKLLLNHNQLEVINYLSQTDATGFIMDIKECISHVHMDISVYDYEQPHQGDLLQSSFLDWSHRCHQLSSVDDDCRATELFAHSLSCLPESSKKDILCRLFTSASPSLLVTPTMNPSSTNSEISFACVTPVLRCPLMAFTSSFDLIPVDEEYCWSLHRIVYCHLPLDEGQGTLHDKLLSKDKADAVLNVSFLLSHILA